MVPAPEPTIERNLLIERVFYLSFPIKWAEMNNEFVQKISEAPLPLSDLGCPETHNQGAAKTELILLTRAQPHDQYRVSRFELGATDCGILQD